MEPKSDPDLTSGARQMWYPSSPEEGGAAVVAVNGAREDQGFAFTGRRNGAPSRLNAFIAAIAIVRSTTSFG